MALPDLSTVGPSRELVEGAGLESVRAFLFSSFHEKRKGIRDHTGAEQSGENVAISVMKSIDYL